MRNRNNHDLSHRLRNNDISAFNAIYWKYHRAVYANAVKLTKDAATAEDIVQDVFVTLWEKRNTIDPKQDIAGWLFVVSHHKTVDQLKRKLRQALADKMLHAIVEEPNYFNNDLTEEQLVSMGKAIAQLSPQKRKVFELCKVQHRTYQKAAEELHISKYTVKEYLSEAMVSIKKYIARQSTHAGIVIYFLAFSQTLPVFFNRFV